MWIGNLAKSWKTRSMVSPWSGRRSHRNVCALGSAHIWLGEKLLEVPSHHSRGGKCEICLKDFRRTS